MNHTSTRTRSRIPVPAVLREEPRYRLLLASQVLSVLGDRMTQVALPFAVLGIGGGLSGVAVVSAAQFVPFVVLALPAGVWTDRWDRRAVLITSDAVRMVAQVVAAALLLSGQATVTSLVAVAAVYGGAEAFFAPAFTGLVPQTVAPENLQPANALRGLLFSWQSIAGPVLAGILLGIGVGPGGALAFDAFSFAVSIALLVRLRPHRSGDAPPVAAGESPSFLTSLRHGWAEVAARSWVLGFLVAIVVYHLLVPPAIGVVGPVLMERELDGSASWAVVMACFGVGAVAGNLVFLRWRPEYPMRTASLLVIGAACQPAFIGSGLGVWWIGVLVLLAGGCLSGAGTLWETSLGAHIPSTALSRVASYDFLSSRGAIPVGNLLVGTVGAAVGLHVVLVCMTLLTMAVALVVAALPSVRLLPPQPVG